MEHFAFNQEKPAAKSTTIDVGNIEQLTRKN
jgi:hypothetical protein